jgi:hypothetical protein
MAGCLKNGGQKLPRYGFAKRSRHGQGAKRLGGSTQQGVAEMSIGRTTVVDQELSHRTRKNSFAENRANTPLQGTIDRLLGLHGRFREHDKQITRLASIGLETAGRKTDFITLPFATEPAALRENVRQQQTASIRR